MKRKNKKCLKYCIKNNSTELQYQFSKNQFFKKKQMKKEYKELRNVAKGQRKEDIALIDLQTSKLEKCFDNNINLNNMNRIDCQLLQDLCQSSKKMRNLSNYFKSLKQNYSTNFSNETPEQLLKQAQSINANVKKRIQKPVTLHPSKSKDSFDPGELKIFLFVLGIYSKIKGITLQELLNEVKQHAESIHKFFPGRSLSLIKFKIASVLSKAKDTCKKIRQWVNEEDFLLYCSVRDKGEEWGDVSFLLFRESNERFFRSSQECRMRWENHLDPNIKKDNWTSEEDHLLLELADQYNFQWCQVSSEFNGHRNQNSIRNRFNSLEKKYKRIFQIQNRKKLVRRILKLLKEEKEINNKQHQIPIDKGSNDEVQEYMKLQADQESQLHLPQLSGFSFPQLSTLPYPQFSGLNQHFSGLNQHFSGLNQHSGFNQDDIYMTQILNREEQIKENKNEEYRPTGQGLENERLELGNQLCELQVEGKVQNFCPSLMEMQEIQYLMKLNEQKQRHECQKFLDEGYSFYLS